MGNYSYNNTTLYGIGYIGLGKYSRKTHLNYYKSWKSMLRRCFSYKVQEKQPTYKVCSVDDQWYNFQNFATWFEKNYVENFELDKDILIKGNKIYSPETCCFVPKEINLLFTKSNSIRGKYPIGVSCRKKDGKFRAQCWVEGKQRFLGSFYTPEEAFQAYKEAKEQEIKRLAKKWRLFMTDECYEVMINYQIERTD